MTFRQLITFAAGIASGSLALASDVSCVAECQDSQNSGDVHSNSLLQHRSSLSVPGSDVCPAELELRLGVCGSPNGDVCKTGNEWQPPRGCVKVSGRPWSAEDDGTRLPCRIEGAHDSDCGQGLSCVKNKCQATVATSSTASADDEDDVHPADGSSNHCRPAGGSGTHKRVRQEILEMPMEKWMAVKSAWRDLQATGEYDYFPQDHSEHYSNPTRDHGKVPGFLPYHRMTMHDLETKLQVIGNDCDITLPYWNWAVNRDSQARAVIFSDDYMGEAQGCIKGGLPGGWHYPANTQKMPGWFLEKMSPRTSEKLKGEKLDSCVKRQVKDRPLKTYRDMMLIVEQSNGDYMKFCEKIEGAHDTFHGMIGGNMASRVDKHSPSDPMFYMHHNFIDSLWFKWQFDFPEHASDCQDSRGRPCRQELRPWIGELNVEDECIYLPISTTFHGNQRATCLSFESTVGSGASILQTPRRNARRNASVHSTGPCARLERQIERGECSVEDLENMPCIDSEMCVVDDADIEEEAAEFSAGNMDEGPNRTAVLDRETKILEEISEETKCKSMRLPQSEDEERVCMSCDYVCGKRG